MKSNENREPRQPALPGPAARRTAAEPWEVEYVHQELPTHSYKEVADTATECKTELGGTNDRKKIVRCVQRKFA